MKSFREYLQESEVAVNLAGDSVANKETPLIKKPLKRDPELVKEAENEDKAFSYQYSKGKWAGYSEFKIPDTLYRSIRLGKEKYGSWDAFMPPTELRKSIQGILYKSGAAVLTSDVSGQSVILRHKRNQRIKFDQELALSESFEDILINSFDMMNECEECNFTCGADEDELSAFDHAYDAAWDYATDELGYSEDHADVFADIVTGFLFEYHNSDEEELDMDALFDQVVLLIRQASFDERLPTPNEDVIEDAKDYLIDYFDLTDSGDIDSLGT